MSARTEALSLWQTLQQEYARYLAAVGFIPTQHMRLQEDLRKFLCLRCAGFLEQLAYVVISDYLGRKISGPAMHFAMSHWERAPNMNASAYSRLMNRFGETNGLAFEEFLSPTRKEVLGDLLSIRNDVAHGKLSNNRLDPQRYIELCDEIYEWMVEAFLADTVDVLDDDGRTIVGRERG